MAVRGEDDVGILMSTDTDMKPAIEAVLEFGGRVDIASWRPRRRADSSRLSIAGKSIYCHWVREDVYRGLADTTDYTQGARLGAINRR
jgi:hypothetical protein